MIMAAVCNFDIFVGCLFEGAEVKFVSPLPWTEDAVFTSEAGRILL